MAVTKVKKFTLVRGTTYLVGNKIFKQGETHIIEDKKLIEHLPTVVDGRGRRRFMEGEVPNAVLASEVVEKPAVVPVTMEEYRAKLDTAGVVYAHDADMDELAALCKKVDENPAGGDGDETI